jgi:hypothetical protein
VITAAAVALAVAGCSSGPVVNTDNTAAAVQPGATAPPSTPPPSNAHLVDAFDYVAHIDDATRYYFTTPSGRWRCAIVPRVKAGCQAAGSAGLGIDGAPDTVPDAQGEPAAPNAIVIDRGGDPHFASLQEPEFTPDPGPANTLQFNRILAAAGFRCNVQESSGVSCLSELTGRGFTFSTEGYTLQYTDVPADAP